MKLHSFIPESPYLLRYLSYALATKARQTIFDYKYFRNYKLKRTSNPSLQKDINGNIGDLKLTLNGRNAKMNDIVSNSDTKSFLVVKGGKIVYQHYADGIKEDTPLLAYSVTKSFFSTYLETLREEGVISFEDALGQYHHDFPGDVGKRTIQSLMNMDSGIRYSHGKNPITDMVKFWLSPNIRHQLRCIRESKVGTDKFLYNDIHLHLLYRLIDSRVSDIPLDFHQSIWNACGMSYDGSFCVDGSRNKWLKADGGLVITAHDLAKFGLLYLNEGIVNGRRVVSADWCNSIKNSEGTRRDLAYWDLYQEMSHRWYPTLKKGRTYYKNFWWGIEQETGLNDIYAMGILGQFVYVSSKNDVVIVRQGNSWGIEGWWPNLFEELAKIV